MHTFFLFDGALLHDTALHELLLKDPEIRLLYEDESPQAARIGPMLLPARQEVARMISQLATDNSELVFGYSLLRSTVRLDQIQQHLQQLRFIHAVSGKRYYFRFADGRAFANVWRTLSTDQRQAILGPVQQWHHYDPAGRQCCGRTAPQQSTSPASALPLQLRPDQWHQVLNATRVGELFLATSKVKYGPPAQGTRAQRYAWTTQIHDRLQQLRIRDTPVRIAATLVVWQTAGFVFGEEVFEAALKKASGSGDISGVLALGGLSAARKGR
ncbi:DUF4123 domain-containing protein [Achromobacter sp.]|uniref:DUF4123 domain-containing protein n=1 Tax=Achromobacter sp. TaxID=134375 RepID=UPI0028A8E42D|nr:DUF4123 domain-containing protein [Achromobacter sp.]